MARTDLPPKKQQLGCEFSMRTKMHTELHLTHPTQNGTTPGGSRRGRTKLLPLTEVPRRYRQAVFEAHGRPVGRPLGPLRRRGGQGRTGESTAATLSQRVSVGGPCAPKTPK